MKKILTVLSLSILLVPTSILAVASTTGGIQNPLGYESFKDLASAVNNFIFVLAIALAPVLFVIGGLMIVTAGGNPLQIQKAQKVILYTAVGLFVILLAQAFVAVLRNVIGVKEAETYLPLIFSSLGLELKKRKVE